MKQSLFLGIIFAILIEIILTLKDPYICSSIDIHNETDLKRIQNCTKIEGHVKLTNFRFTTTTDIATNIEEISNYLLIYRIEGLNSLEDIFPNLTIIRGHELLFDKYSLVLYENREIRNIGLKSLLKIRSGQIKIESNPVLCYTNTINWMYLVQNHYIQHFSLRNNQVENECPKCVKISEHEKDKVSQSTYFRFNCWNKNNYQLIRSVEKINDCPAECEDGGCTGSGECCSYLCLSGCRKGRCHICKDFMNSSGKCIPTCNFPFYKLGDKCLTENQCKAKGLIPHAGSCIEHCPPSYQNDKYNQHCNLTCDGNFTIRSKKDLEKVRNCIVIQGSLHIELKGDQTDHIIQELENALGGITEIRDFLKVTNSPQIMSLSFLRKLDTIRGDHLIDKEVALYVVDNFHLEEIWSNNHKVAIFKGRVFFHLNPRLCYSKILELVPSLKSVDKILIRDASLNSNGERNICGSGVQQIYPKIEAVNATAARVKLSTIPAYDRYAFLGYTYYYKEAPLQNVSMFDGRHGCGRDNWKMDLKLSSNIRHVFSNLKPNTQYAYYVRTFSSLQNNYHNMDWYSEVQYFNTTVDRPGGVQKIYSVQIGKTAVAVHWWPPKNTNGVIDKYIIRHVLTNHHFRYIQIYGYNSDKQENGQCECDFKQKVRGAPPMDVDYYNREKVIFQDAAMNFIYVSSKYLKKIQKELEEEDKTRRKRETPSTTVKPIEKTLESNKSISQTLDFNLTATTIILKNHMEEVEMKSKLEQDTGIENFPIIMPPVVCPANETDSSKKKDNCEPLECYLGTDVSGIVHSHILDDLVPDQIYQVFIRACVQDLENGCGPEKSIEIETHAKKL